MQNNAAAGLLEEVLGRNQRSGMGANSPQDAVDCPLNVVAESAKHILSTMFNVDTRVSTATAGAQPPRESMSGIVSLSGAARMLIVVNLSQELACSMTEWFSGGQRVFNDPEVRDLVGELANMIVGHAKDRLGINGLVLGLPTVVVGNGHQVAFGSDMQVNTLTLNWDTGRMHIELGMA